MTVCAVEADTGELSFADRQRITDSYAIVFIYDVVGVCRRQLDGEVEILACANRFNSQSLVIRIKI